MRRVETAAEVRRLLPWRDDTVHVFDLGDAQARPAAFVSAVYFFLLGFPAGTFGLWWLVGLASAKVAFWLAAGFGVLLLGACLADYARRLAGRPARLAGTLSAWPVLWAASCAAFVLVTPGPVRAGLVLDGEGGFLSWLGFFVVQGLDIALAGLPRALGLSSLGLTPTTLPARAGLAAFNVTVALSLVETLRAVWRLHFSPTTHRETVREMHREAAGVLAIDLSAEGEDKGVDVVCHARMRALAEPAPADPASLAGEDDPIRRWEVASARRSVSALALRLALVPALPLAGWAAARAASLADARAGALFAAAAAAGLLLWRARSVRRTLAGSALERRAAGALSIQAPALLALGLVIHLFTGAGVVQEGLSLPAAPGLAEWTHFLVYQVLNALFVDLPDSLQLLVPAIAVSAGPAGVALSVFKLVVALGLVEALVAAWRAVSGRDEVYATGAQVAAALERLPRRARDGLVLVATHVEEPLDEPFVLSSALLERAWDGERRAHERGLRRLSLRAQGVVGAAVLAAAALGVWLLAPGR